MLFVIDTGRPGYRYTKQLIVPLMRYDAMGFVDAQDIAMA